jgi:hypothetical protein
MRTVVGILFFIACIVGLVIGTVKLISSIWTNYEYSIGPHSLHTLYADDIFSPDKPSVVSLKSNCNYVIVGLDSKETITADRIPPTLGEESDKYLMTNVTLNGRYQLALCTADIYSENGTTITVDVGLEDKVINSFLLATVDLFLFLVIFYITGKITYF